MENNKILSIVVPVFNVEQYLERCLDSIVFQLNESHELILVDDGSTDSSSVIIDRYRPLAFVKTVRQENRGLGAARNTGLYMATGKYILFIDSDDWMAQNSLVKLLAAANKADADVITFNMIHAFEDGKLQYIGESDTKFFEGRDQIVTEILLKRAITNSSCDKIYKRELFDRHKISFPVGCYFEDVITNIKIANHACSFYCCGEFLYYYYKRDNSITNSHNDKYYQDYMLLINQLADYLKVIGLRQQLFKEFSTFVSSVFWPHYLELLRDNNKELLKSWYELIYEKERFDIRESLAKSKQLDLIIALLRNRIINPVSKGFIKFAYRSYLNIK